MTTAENSRPPRSAEVRAPESTTVAEVMRRAVLVVGLDDLVGEVRGALRRGGAGARGGAAGQPHHRDPAPVVLSPVAGGGAGAGPRAARSGVRPAGRPGLDRGRVAGADRVPRVARRGPLGCAHGGGGGEGPAGTARPVTRCAGGLLGAVGRVLAPSPVRGGQAPVRCGGAGVLAETRPDPVLAMSPPPADVAAPPARRAAGTAERPARPRPHHAGAPAVRPVAHQPRDDRGIPSVRL